jgi:hypothetical protein
MAFFNKISTLLLLSTVCFVSACNSKPAPSQTAQPTYAGVGTPTRQPRAANTPSPATNANTKVSNIKIIRNDNGNRFSSAKPGKAPMSDSPH